MKIPKIHLGSSSETPEAIAVSIPESWADLTPHDFEIFLEFMISDLSQEFLTTALFLRLANFRVLAQSAKAAESPEESDYLVQCRDMKWRPVFRLKAASVAVGAYKLRYLMQIPPLCELRRLIPALIKKHVSVDFAFESFESFLSADNFYTGYLLTGREDLLESLSNILMPGCKRKWRKPLALIWFSSLKQWLVERFAELFADVPADEMFGTCRNNPAAVREAVDAQIRALTKGDVTRERDVLAVPTHRALTELNELAREYREFKEKTK